MEKKKINKEKKKRNNLPIIMALCAVIGTSCSVLALTQDFSLGSIFNSPSSTYDVIISPENVHDCTLLPATTTSVLQATNGDIEISTDGHIQVPLFDSKYDKIKSSKVFTMSFDLDLKTNGAIGFTFPYRYNSSNSKNFPSLYLNNDNGVLSLYFTKVHHLYNEYETTLDCFSEDSILAYADLSDIKDLSNIKVKILYNDEKYTVLINGKNVEWFIVKDIYIRDNALDSSVHFNADLPICLDAYNVQATITNFTFEVYNKGE